MSSILKILLVEDDRSLAAALALALSSTYEVDIAESGKLALYKSETENFDIVILDINLPDISGLFICEQFRERGVNAPILILSGENKVLTKISLLDAGANDYLTKPVSLGELKARLRALTRFHKQTIWPSAKIEAYGLVLDQRTFTLKREEKIIYLRRKEFALLECLMRHAGEVVTRVELINNVWQNIDDLWTNTLDVHIKYLRDKIDKPFKTKLIHTVHGRGYKLEPTAALLLEKVVN